MKNYVRILSLAAIYYLVSKLYIITFSAVHVNILIWPHVGIALAYIIIYGFRMWPGIFLGAFLTYYDLMTHSFQSESVVVLAIIMVLGPVLQAMITGLLLKTFIKQPMGLTTLKEVIKFFLIAGLFGSIIVPIFLIVQFPIFGYAYGSLLWSKFFEFWVSSAMGNFLVVPLVLIVIGQPTDVWRSRRFSLAIPVVLMVVVLTSLYVYLVEIDRDKMKLEFRQKTSQVATTIEYVKNQYFEALYSLKSLYYSSDSINREDFGTFAKEALLRLDGIQAFQWVPAVLEKDKGEYIREAKKSGYPDFSFKVLNESNQLVPAPKKNVYFPIYFIEPRLNNEELIGIDLGSRKKHKDAILQSCLTTYPIATAPIFLDAIEDDAKFIDLQKGYSVKK